MRLTRFHANCLRAPCTAGLSPRRWQAKSVPASACWLCLHFPRMRLFRPRRLLESTPRGHADQQTAMHSVPAAFQAAGQRGPSRSRGHVSQIVDARNSWHVMSSSKVKEHCCARITSRHSRSRHDDGLSPQPDIPAWHDQILSIPSKLSLSKAFLPVVGLYMGIHRTGFGREISSVTTVQI